MGDEMKTHDQMRMELQQLRESVGLTQAKPWEYGYCHAQRDGDCNHSECPQNRDGEPGKTGRHCPIDIHAEERGYQ